MARRREGRLRGIEKRARLPEMYALERWQEAGWGKRLMSRGISVNRLPEKGNLDGGKNEIYSGGGGGAEACSWIPAPTVVARAQTQEVKKQ